MLVANFHFYRMDIGASNKTHQKLAIQPLHHRIICPIANEELFDIKFAIRPVLAKTLIDWLRERVLPIFPTREDRLDKAND
jgi:hypothetical protein